MIYKLVKDIDDHLNSAIPEVLWHYTSMQGFIGIIETKRVWATDIRHLNDRKEFEHGKDLIRAQIDSLRIEPDDELGTQKLLIDILERDLDKGFFNTPNEEIYVSSFSAKGDQLSQWRGYTPSGQGLSLGFDLSGMRPPPGSGLFSTIAPCIYTDDAKHRIIRAAMASVRDAARLWQKRVDELYRETLLKGLECDHEKLPWEIRQPFHDAAICMGLGLKKMLILFKDESFSEETEWRFFGVRPADARPEGFRRFLRVSGSRMIPTVDPLIAGAGIFPLREVVVGPCPEQALQVEAVRKFLNWNGLDHVVVRTSKIPYRSW